jgi:general stress protein YciG
MEIPMTDDSTPNTEGTFSAPALASDPPKKKRGFATMSPEQVRELARRGGVAAHRMGTAHEFTRDEARAAGRKGALARSHLQFQPRDSNDTHG